MTERRGIWAAAGLLLGGAMAGCAPHYLVVDGAGRTTAAPPKGDMTSMPANSPDTCGAGKLQYLVGKSRFQVPVPTDLNSQRVVCTTCIRSDLFNPKRVSILYDQPSGVVTKVVCQ
jgi:hypothetical protein